MSLSSLNCLRHLCSLDFLKSEELRKSSLKRINCSRPDPQNMNNNESLLDATLTKQESTKSGISVPLDSKKEPETPCRAEKEKSPICEKDFRIMQVMNSGESWRTYMVKKENEDSVHIMRLMGKRRMTVNNIENQVALEKTILEKAKFPFISKLEAYFENDKKVFFLMEHVERKETLSCMLKQLARFSEEISRFYAAEILLTLEYLHQEMQVSYNNLKLKTLVLDEQMHIKFNNFSKAKRFTSQESPNNSSTGFNNSQCMEQMDDFWAFGSVLYEMLTGKKPFTDSTEEESTSIALDDCSPANHLGWPASITKNARDLVTRLLNPDVTERLGYGGIEEIKKHAFFAQVNWEKMLTKSVYPPLAPIQHRDDDHKELENLEDEDHEEHNLKFVRHPSLNVNGESSSNFTSDEEYSAVSYERYERRRSSRLNSILSYKL